MGRIEPSRWSALRSLGSKLCNVTQTTFAHSHNTRSLQVDTLNFRNSSTTIINSSGGCPEVATAEYYVLLFLSSTKPLSERSTTVHILRTCPTLVARYSVYSGFSHSRRVTVRHCLCSLTEHILFKRLTKKCLATVPKLFDKRRDTRQNKIRKQIQCVTD